MEKCGFFLKNCCFSGRIWPDWGSTAQADLAGVGSIGLKMVNFCAVIESADGNRAKIAIGCVQIAMWGWAFRGLDRIFKMFSLRKGFGFRGCTDIYQILRIWNNHLHRKYLKTH